MPHRLSVCQWVALQLDHLLEIGVTMTVCPVCGGRMRKAWADKPLHLTSEQFRDSGYHWVCSKCGVGRTREEMDRA